MTRRLALLLSCALAACSGPEPATSEPPPVAQATPAILVIDLPADSTASATESTPMTDSTAAAEPEPPGMVVDAATLPGPMREFRAAWIATVANIDWPSRAGLAPAEQRAELVALLDRAVDLNLNAIVLQVRPMADALYFSPHEPWSAFLTGDEGMAPNPWYDPLEFAVEEAHARGLELHAWFNPYRADHPASIGRRDLTHIARQRPSLVRTYGGYRWLDPGEPEAVDHSMRVIMDVVRRYDVDGVHLDDYFYPYPTESRGRRVAFPDRDSYARAVSAGETLGRDDWRRQNVDRFIERMYREVKALKPHVKVGISPFGIWRPGYPETVTGFDQYAELYADARQWWREGWLDYLAPQLYWSIESRGQSFPALLDWWGSENVQDRHLWPGLYTSRLLPEVGGYGDTEIPDQVEVVRADPEATGTIHFSMKALLDRFTDVGPRLAEGPYDAPALVPASPWLDDTPPAAPLVFATPRDGAVDVVLAEGDEQPAWRWIVRAQRGGEWSWEVIRRESGTVVLGPTVNGDVEVVAVSAVDRAGNEGPARLVEIE
ncbi:MAG: family 10 glycosylhydrolase [Bacteroidota bacterium]